MIRMVNKDKEYETTEEIIRDLYKKRRSKTKKEARNARKILREIWNEFSKNLADSFGVNDRLDEEDKEGREQVVFD